MVGSSHFAKSCPTCGRLVHIQVRYMGRELNCGHCNGQFVAYHDDRAADDRAATEDSLSSLGSPTNLMQRAEELLNSLDDVA